MTTPIDAFATATQMLAALDAGRVSAVDLLELHQAIGPCLEDRTPLRFAALLAREVGGFTRPPGYE
jgi:hypothetical protein